MLLGKVSLLILQNISCSENQTEGHKVRSWQEMLYISEEIYLHASSICIERKAITGLENF